MKIEDKLQKLAECGLSLRPEFSVDDLLESWDREDLDGPDYDLAMVCLGMTHEEPPWTPHCDRLWHSDTECITDTGDYAAIAKRFVAMTDGSLPITDIEDHVDLDEGVAWLRFLCDGEPMQLDFEVNDDWLDASIVDHFARLLAEHDDSKVFFGYAFGGQDLIVGCLTREEFAKLKALIPEATIAG